MGLKLDRILLAFFIIVILVAGSLDKYQTNKRHKEILDSIEITKQEIVIVKNKNSSIEKELETLYKNNDEALQLIKKLNVPQKTIEYIIKETATIKPETPVAVFEQPPAQYSFELKNKLRVADFKYDQDYTYTTYDLKFKNTIVVADKKTSSLIEVASSYDPEHWVEVPSELSVTNVDPDFKHFDVNIGMLAGVSLPESKPQLGLYLSPFHLEKNVDVFSLYAAYKSSDAVIGLIPISGNLGGSLPVISDLWLMPGVSIDTKGKYNMDLMIGSRF